MTSIRLALCFGVVWTMVTLAGAPTASAQTTRESPAPPVVEGRWLRPAASDSAAMPEWGFADGIRVGLSPMPGPRGLLRVYTPYLGQNEPTMLNFIAIEPIPAGSAARGLSEMEFSELDRTQGKRFWSTDDLTSNEPLSSDRPARGVVKTVDGVEELSVVVHVERFANGADVRLRLRFRADRPHEFGIAVFADKDSVPLAHCIASATMGNYARIRELELADRTVHARELWPAFSGDGFAPHASFPLSELKRTAAGDAAVSAVPDEVAAGQASYESSVRAHWKYVGRRARQMWRMPSPPDGLRAQVNGRVMYWASHSPIPGGIAFENFELVAPFEQGQEFWFGAEPMEADPHAPAPGSTTRPAADAGTVRGH